MPCFLNERWRNVAYGLERQRREQSRRQSKRSEEGFRVGWLKRLRENVFPVINRVVSNSVVAVASRPLVPAKPEVLYLIETHYPIFRRQLTVRHVSLRESANFNKKSVWPQFTSPWSRRKRLPCLIVLLWWNRSVIASEGSPREL